jgi:purine-binding chemotaxis protein CheW
MTAVAPASHGRRSRSATNKYLTLVLAKEHYGVPILKVQEIIGLQDITPVPRMPSEVRGVLNLRGRVIPVIDMRSRFGLDRGEDTKRTCIVVVQVSNPVAGSPSVIMGVVVDQVSEVQDIPPEQIEPAPALGASVDTAFIAGVGKVGKRVVMLLDIDRALGSAAAAFPL